MVHGVKPKKEEKEKQQMIHVLLFFKKDRISNLYKCGTYTWNFFYFTFFYQLMDRLA